MCAARDHENNRELEFTAATYEARRLSVEV